MDYQFGGYGFLLSLLAGVLLWTALADFRRLEHQRVQLVLPTAKSAPRAAAP
jgi:hypothetical protein